MLRAFSKITNAIVGFVNRVRKPDKRTLNAFVPKERREQFLDEARYAAGRPHLVLLNASVSSRYSATRLLTMREGVTLGMANDKDVAIYDLPSQTPLNDVPTSENIFIHKQLYQAAPDSFSILLFDAPNLRGLIERGQEPDLKRLGENFGSHMVLKVLESDTLTPEIATAPLIYIRERGLLSHAPTLPLAVDQAELCESLCARQLDRLLES